MKTRDKLLPVAQGARDKAPTIALGVVLLAGLFQGVRHFGGSLGIVALQPAGQVLTRAQLVGTWELTGTVTDGVERPYPKNPYGPQRMTLNEDGSAISAPGGPKGIWYVGDTRHLHIAHPPMEVVYEIRSISPDRLVAFPSLPAMARPPFGAKLDFVWSRVATVEESETSQ